MESVRTGDILFFCNNTATGFLLRTCVSTMWNHVGIAIRVHSSTDQYDHEYERISLSGDGELYVLEINTGERKDVLTNDNVIGAGFSSLDVIGQRYNFVAVRRLHDNFRTLDLAKNTVNFANKYRGYEFTKGVLPFISVWLGIPLSGIETRHETSEMFCSEMCALYYNECIGPITGKISGTKYDGNLKTLFGIEAPCYPNMYSPEIFTWNLTPNSTIFNGDEQVVYHDEADIGVVLFQPVVIIFAIIVIIAMTLRYT